MTSKATRRFDINMRISASLWICHPYDDLTFVPSLEVLRMDDSHGCGPIPRKVRVGLAVELLGQKTFSWSCHKPDPPSKYQEREGWAG